MTPTDRGLGDRKVEEHAPAAFTASWHEASQTCGEKGSSDSCLPVNQPQSAASAEIDRSTLESLTRANQRDVQRLRRLDVDHANAWISAMPTYADGKDTVMRPRVYL